MLRDIRGGHLKDPQARINSAMNDHVDVASVGMTVEIRTPPLIPEPLDGLPENVAKAFRQAEDNFNRPGNEESAATMYRRAVERAIAVEYPDIKGSNLAQRIDNLVKDHIVPDVMGKWAHEVRFDGNDGAHDEEVTREQLEQTRAFADAFLRYLIVLPKLVESRRAPPEVIEEPVANDVAQQE